jgi:hypothetical protein
MKQHLFIMAAVAALGAGQAFGACNYPKAPENLPDGSTATEAEMIAAQKLVRAYDSDINTYLACIKKEHEELMARDGGKMTSEQKEEQEHMQVQKHNAAIDELEAVAGRFNEQVKVFKSKGKKG